MRCTEDHAVSLSEIADDMRGPDDSALAKDAREVCSGAGLSLPDLPERLDRVGVRGRLVRTVALDPREPQGEAARIVRTRLQVVERHLHHQLGAHMHGVALAGDLELLELRGLPR